MISAASAGLWLCLGLALAAAICDIRTRRIPNWLNGLLAVSALATSYLTGSWELVGLSAVHALIALVVGMALFAIGFVGAGDAKMYSAAAFAIPLGKALPMLGWTSLAGFVLLVSMFAARKLSGQPIKRDGKSFTIPYGVAIASGFWGAALI